MYFRAMIPRVFHRARWMGPHCPKRLMGWKRDVPIARPWGRPAFPIDRWWGFPRPGRMMAQMERDFEDMWRAMNQMWSPRYRDRYPARQSEKQTPELQVNYDDKTFEVRLNVEDYGPDDLQVKVVDDQLLISGKHSERVDDHGSVTREFTRQIRIPEDVDPETVACDISEEGLLTIEAKIKDVSPSSERVININRKTPSPNEQGTTTEAK